LRRLRGGIGETAPDEHQSGRAGGVLQEFATIAHRLPPLSVHCDTVKGA
jgi:hypothetical protein